MQRNFKKIGENLYLLRKRQGMSQAQFCFFLKVNQSQYSKLERGTQPLKTTQIIDLCRIFKLSPDFFFSDNNANNELKS